MDPNSCSSDNLPFTDTDAGGSYPAPSCPSDGGDCASTSFCTGSGNGTGSMQSPLPMPGQQVSYCGGTVLWPSTSGEIQCVTPFPV